MPAIRVVDVSPGEIAAACEAIRESWSPYERWIRSGERDLEAYREAVERRRRRVRRNQRRRLREQRRAEIRAVIAAISQVGGTHAIGRK